MMKKVIMCLAVVAVMMVSSASAGILKVDFNSNQDGGGDSTTAGDPGLSVANHNQAGWSSYHANHEVAAEFSTANYGGITVTPAGQIRRTTAFNSQLTAAPAMTTIGTMLQVILTSSPTSSASIHAPAMVVTVTGMAP
jgi:hypothetical protein